MRHLSWQSTRPSNGRITRSIRGGVARRSPLPATIATPRSGRSGPTTECGAQACWRISVRWFFSMKRTIVSPSGMSRLSNSTISDGRSSALADTSPRYTPTHCDGCSSTSRGRSFESISADFENSRSPLAILSGPLPRRDSIGLSGSVIRRSSFKRRCRLRHGPRQSRSSGRFRAEHDAESTVLERRRHAATSVSQSIEGRATLRCRAARARRPFSPDRGTDATRFSHAPVSGLPRRGLNAPALGQQAQPHRATRSGFRLRGASGPRRASPNRPRRAAARARRGDRRAEARPVGGYGAVRGLPRLRGDGPWRPDHACSAPARRSAAARSRRACASS